MGERPGPLLTQLDRLLREFAAAQHGVPKTRLRTTQGALNFMRPCSDTRFATTVPRGRWRAACYIYKIFSH
jgi:hypothetical protein